MSPQDYGDIQYLSESMNEVVAKIWGENFMEFAQSMITWGANVKDGFINRVTAGRHLTHEHKHLLHRREDIGFDGLAMKYRPHNPKGLNVTDKILSWLPEAERKILALCIGRIMNNDDGSTWRTVPIINGRPGLGKTMFVSKLGRHLERLGCVVAHIGAPIDRFTFNIENAAADFWITDDTSRSDIEGLTRNSTFKSLASNSDTVVEDKYVQPVTVKPCGSWFMLGNAIHRNHLIGADPGVLDRIAILQCNPEDTRSTDVIEKDACMQLGMDATALWEELLAECSAYYRQNVGNMEKAINDLRNHCIEPPTELPLAELAAIGIVLHHTADSDGNPFVEWSLDTILESIAVGQHWLPQSLVDSLQCIQWKATVRSIRRRSNMGVEPSPKTMTQYIRTTDGHTLPSTMAPYAQSV